MGIRELASSLGYEGDGIDVLCVLDLPVPEARLSALDHWARERSGGYQAVTWAGLPPAEWREAYCHMRNLEDLDLPPEHRDLHPWTAEALDSWLRCQIPAGGELITSLIVDAAGAPAATCKQFMAGPPHACAFLGGDATVLDAHRTHRLWTTATLAVLHRLTVDFPQSRSLHAEAAVDNEASWSIKERLGFRILPQPRPAAADPH